MELWIDSRFLRFPVAFSAHNQQTTAAVRGNRAVDAFHLRWRDGAPGMPGCENKLDCSGLARRGGVHRLDDGS
jgi:hypothetical protein